MGNKLHTVINIKTGNAAIGATNVPLGGQNLTGDFTKQWYKAPLIKKNITFSTKNSTKVK